MKLTVCRSLFPDFVDLVSSPTHFSILRCAKICTLLINLEKKNSCKLLLWSLHCTALFFHKSTKCKDCIYVLGPFYLISFILNVTLEALAQFETKVKNPNINCKKKSRNKVIFGFTQCFQYESVRAVKIPWIYSFTI